MSDRILNNHTWLEFEQTYRRRGTLDLSGPLTFSEVIVQANELGFCRLDMFGQDEAPTPDLPMAQLSWRDRELFAQAVLDHLQDIGLAFMTVAHTDGPTPAHPDDGETFGYIDIDPRT